MNTLISFDMECLQAVFLVVLDDQQPLVHRVTARTAVQSVNPAFHCRRGSSVQDQVVLHEAQLWKQDTQLHQGGERRQ